MKHTTIAICLVAIFFAACNNEAKTDGGADSSKVTSDAKTDEKWQPVDSATAQKAWMEYATPGAMQKMMADWCGDWNGEGSMWMAPDAAAITASSTMSTKMIFDGRYQEGTYEGNMMGMPFQGKMTMGYDNAKKEFVSSWIDNMGTGILNTSGTWDDASKTLTLQGEQSDPTRPGKTCHFRETLKIVDNNTQIMSMYGPDMKTGKEFKTMEIKLTRKK